MVKKCPRGKMEFGNKCVNPNSKLNYKETDFKTLKGVKQTFDKRIPYSFRSKDGEIEANFFWITGDVQIRSMVGDCGMVSLGYPFARPETDPHRKPPESKKILQSFLRRLNDVKYKETKC